MGKSGYVVNATGAIRATPNGPIKRYITEAKANEGKAIEELIEENSLNCDICGAVCGKADEKNEVGSVLCKSCLEEAKAEQEKIEKEEKMRKEKKKKDDELAKKKAEEKAKAEAKKKDKAKFEKTDTSELEKGNFPA